ncbi:MAG TPA: HAD-IB family phosphatase [Sphingomonas sp.]|jgi:HAD superfamily phosphoserine phosphatase-like hydrolase|uniref:HAD family hydrolase n=1 Tax=Sphingomonas sp. TaxID=28214 RepID=UPI002EDAB0CD
MTELAIYDMDRTITRTGTYTPFLLHAAARLAPWRLLLAPAVPIAMLAYAAKLIDRKRLKEVNQRLLLGGGVLPARLAPVTASFADRILKANVHPGALRQIAEDRAAGRRLVLATASYRLYVGAIAARLGFDDVIATGTMTGLDDRILPRVDGENCYGPAKLRMILAWMMTQGLDRAAVTVRFYSDHVSDGCVLDWADAPFAVNASAKLRSMARAKGWPLLDWGV